MTQQLNLLELAKQGDARAIAALINRSLQHKGITAKATFKDGCLQITLESEQVPEQQYLVALIRKGITSLGAKSIKKLNIYGKQTSNHFIVWHEEIELINPVNYTPSKPNTARHQLSSTQLVANSKKLEKSIQSSQTRKNFRKKHIIALGSLTVFVLIFGSFVGLALWLRSVQTQTMVKAQTLTSKVEDTKNVLDINSLKATEEQLKQVVTILDKAPKLPLPGSISPNIEFEKAKIISRLNAVNESIKVIEQLLPEATKLVEQFSALNSRLDVGMNYRDYGEEVSELKVALDRFARQPGASSYPVYENLAAAFEDYNFALNVWRYYIESDETNKLFPVSSSYGTILVSEYQVEIEDILGEEYIYLNTALSKVWGRASERMESTQGQINSKTQGKIKAHDYQSMEPAGI